jgi:hypothetical protein
MKTGPLEEKDIIVTTSTESVLSGPEKRLKELIGGSKPMNAHEEQIVKDIEKIKKAGRIIDIPGM